jgi:hypothetical protein
LCDQRVAQFEEEIDALSMESQIDRATLLWDVRETLGAQAASVWAAGGLPGLHTPPVLLAFLRQLSQQGWAVKEGVPLSCPEAAQVRVRELRHNGSSSRPSPERGLDGQSTSERADAVRVLSSILARHTQEAWADTYTAYAEIGFPLTTGALARVGRLRGYGNAINAEAARIFIEAVMG